MAIEAEQSEARSESSHYRRVLRNRTLLSLWSGQSVSMIGDTFL